MKKTKFLLFFIATACAFTACQKSATTLSHADEEKQVLASLRALSPGAGTAAGGQARTTEETFDYRNDRNPYEWVGTAHNNSLDYAARFMDNLLDDSRTLTLSVKEPYSSETVNMEASDRNSKMTIIMQKYFNEKVAPSYPAERGLDIRSEQYWANTSIRYFTTHKYVYPQVNGLDAYNQDIWRKLSDFTEAGWLTSFEAHADSIVIAKIMETQDIQQSLDLIKESEDVVLRSSLGRDIVTRQLVFLSILRNSIGYWANVMQDTTNPWWSLNERIWNVDGPHEGYAKWSWRKFWETVTTGIADGLGAAAGGPTVVGNAIGGAIASGIVAALW